MARFLVRMVIGVVLTFGVFKAGVRWGGLSFAPADMGTALVLIGYLGLIGFVWTLLLGLPFVDWIGEKAGSILYPSNAGFEVKPQYSIAEAREREGHYAEAIEVYRGYKTRYPGEVTPYFRIADLQSEKLGKPRAAIAELRDVLTKARGVEVCAHANFRLAELYMERLHDVGAALDCLREVQRRFPGTRQAADALTRAGRLLPSPNE